MMARDLMWTTFISERGKLHIGRAKSFVQCSSRGTNAYRERTVLLYLLNLYVHVSLYNFYLSRGIRLNREGYALTNMLQWIWRSAIRDGERILIYVPSRRMRELLQRWMRTLKDRRRGGIPTARNVGEDERVRASDLEVSDEDAAQIDEMGADEFNSSYEVGEEDDFVD
jgi:hypothetical protein